MSARYSAQKIVGAWGVYDHGDTDDDAWPRTVRASLPRHEARQLARELNKREDRKAVIEARMRTAGIIEQQVAIDNETAALSKAADIYREQQTK